MLTYPESLEKLGISVIPPEMWPVQRHEPRSDRRVSEMSDEAITHEIADLSRTWDEVRAGDGHSGSPGEWMLERLDELDAEAARRRSKGEPE